MLIKKAEFVKSYDNYRNCPNVGIPEYAFIGRSNVGKSTLINMLAGKQKLAKISSRPGKTQLINHFIINDNWYLVDLPGYGWARASKEDKGKWDIMVKNYLEHRENLHCVFVLIDSRLEPQKIDLEFIDWLGKKNVPFVLVFTKADKQSKNKTGIVIAKFEKEMLKTWEDVPAFFVTSSVSEDGKKEILNFIDETNAVVKEEKKNLS